MEGKVVKQMIRYTLGAITFVCAGFAAGDNVYAQRPAAHPAGHAGHAVPSATAASANAAAPAIVAAPREASTADTTITLRTVGSNLEFVPSEIAVKAGTRLRIRYVNEGTFPHNVVIVKTEADIDALGLAAFDAADNGYVPTTKTDRMVAHSKLAAPGETVEFEFVVPEPGQYPLACLYPGHYNMMVGMLRSLP